MFHRHDRILRFRLNHFHEIGDFAGRLSGTFRQLADLVGDDGESCARLTGAGRLNRGVKREQVSLIRDISNRRYDLGNFE